MSAIDHPAFWMLQQLHYNVSRPDWFIAFRAIVNLPPYEKDGKHFAKDTRVVFEENIRIGDLRDRWENGLLDQLTQLNQQEKEPANIYFGVNPRTHIRRNKIEDVAGYNSFYLDCDDNKSYTKDQRLFQIEFWRDCNFVPSMVVDSGNGYHVYWMLNELMDDKVSGQNILRKMVALSGCKDKGNTHDPTRILRLPGFFNVKEWFKGKRPFCSLIEPADFNTCEEPFIYEPAQFDQYFPPSELENISIYHQRANELDTGTPLKERVRQIANAAAEARAKQQIQAVARDMANDPNVTHSMAFQSQLAPLPGQQPNQKIERVPTLSICPPFSEMKFHRSKRWVKWYAQAGWDGLTVEQKENMSEMFNSNEFSASELDCKVMFYLIDMGYNWDAIHELWHRRDLKLLRPDKIAKNANYLRITYDKALTMVQNAAIAGAGDSKLRQPRNAEILVSHRQTSISRTNGRIDPLITAEVILLGKFTDQDAETAAEREWFDIRLQVATQNGENAYDRLVPGLAFGSIAEFKKRVCGENVRILSDKSADLQMLISYLERTFHRAKTRGFHSKIVYKNGEFSFPKVLIKKDGFVDKDDVSLQDELTRRYQIYNWFENNYFSREQASNFLRQYWGPLLGVHLPRLVLSVMGTIAASAIRPIIEKELGIDTFHLPTVNIRGGSSSGKTETVKLLMKCTGIVGGQNSISTKSTLFSLQRQLEITNFIPLIIDEFKKNEQGSNERDLEQIRELVRRIYSGEQMLRGRADLTVTHFNVHAALFVVGEHALERIGDLSEVSRIVPIVTDEYQPQLHAENFVRLHDLPFNRISPLFYQFVLNLDAAAIYAEFKEMKTSIVGSLRTKFGDECLRMSHNLAVLKIGCVIWDRFVQSVCPGAPTLIHTLNFDAHIVEYFKSWAVTEGQSISYSTDLGEEKPIQNNEFFRMLAGFQEMIDTEYQYRDSITPLAHMFEVHKENELWIHVSQMHAAWSTWMRNQGKTACDKTKIMALLRGAEAKQEPWIKEHSQPRILKQTKKNTRVAILDLNILKRARVWFTNIDQKAAEQGML